MKTEVAGQTEDCKIHGASTRAVNRTLYFLIAAAFAMIVWHVWAYGPTGRELQADAASRSFPVLLGWEIWDLFFDGHGILAELEDVFIYFLVGILIAGFIRTYKLAIKLRNSLIKYGVLSIFIASLVGVITPLCACGILTTAMSLLFAGLPLAPVMALLVSSPLISPSSYLLTLNDLGPDWTVIRTVAAFSMGIFAGLVTHFLRTRGFRTDELFLEGAVVPGDFHDEDYPDERLKCNCKVRFGNRVAAKTKSMFLIFLAKSTEMIWTVGKYVLVGIAVGSVIERYMPSEWLYTLFGKDDKLNIVWITFGAVPIFLHQISASSILHHIKGTLDGTLNGGAGLAFLIGGPVTAIPTMTMLWAMFRKRVFALYMFICIAGTLLFAYSFQYFVFVPNVDTDNPLLRGVSSLSGGESAVLKKGNKNVNIVMDPGGKGIIATYENDLMGTGGIVFDAGLERFLKVSADRVDNRKYIQNIAKWLEERNSSLNARNILIYNTVSKSGLENRKLNLKEALTQQNKDRFDVTMTDRNETPEITEELLDSYSQVWIFLGGSDSGCCFSDEELERISEFTEGGSSMLVIAGHLGDMTEGGWKNANRLSSRFGVTFSGLVQNGEQLTVSTTGFFFERMSAVLKNMYRFMK